MQFCIGTGLCNQIFPFYSFRQYSDVYKRQLFDCILYTSLCSKSIGVRVSSDFRNRFQCKMCIRDRSRSTLHKMSKNAAGSTTEIYVVVKKGSGIDSLSQLEGKTIGYQKGVDKKNAAYAREKLDSEVGNTTPKEELDYTTLYSDLNLETVNAFVISDSYYDMSKSNIDGFADSVDIIQTYKKKNDAASGPDIDVTKDTLSLIHI